MAVAETQGHADSYESQKRIGGAVLTAVLKICLLIGVGMHLERKGMLNGAKRKCLSALAMDVCLPCLLFTAVLPEADVTLLQEGWELLLWPLAYATVGAILGVLCCLLVGIPMQHVGAAAACAAFPNVNGFPVSVISALGHFLPKSPGNGFSAMTFLSVLQLTDGMVKYTIGPAVFRRDKRARERAKSGKCTSDGTEGEAGKADVLPLGSSLHSINSDTACNAHPIESLDEQPGLDDPLLEKPDLTDFGLRVDQIRTVEPDWSRFDSYKVYAMEKWATARSMMMSQPAKSVTPESKAQSTLASDFASFLRTIFPPQVSAVLLALAIGMGPSWMKELLISQDNGIAYFSFIFGTAKELGKGFVPLQMISLGGRMLNVLSDSGPLASNGVAGPRGRSKLLRIAGAVSVARMFLAPTVLYFLARAVDTYYFQLRGQGRPLAFWAPALIVASMPTANNMSTMADIIGSGRSIAAASTALQLLMSPLVLVISLSLVLQCASDLALDS